MKPFVRTSFLGPDPRVFPPPGGRFLPQTTENRIYDWATQAAQYKVLYRIRSYYFMSVFFFFNKVADDVVNGTGKVLCMKGQCHNRLIEFYPLLVYTYVIFPHDHALAISQVGNLTLLCLVE